MLMKTHLCFHCLENVSSQLLYRALSRVASMVRKRFLFHYDIIPYVIHMRWMCQTHQLKDNSLIIRPRINKFFTLFPFMFSYVGCQLAILVEILVTIGTKIM